ncbi:MAG: preprotein translocase subunit SecY [Clostridia bacterium]|nr:preprotein translocase subunit SecY [Clostridia bacterium]
MFQTLKNAFLDKDIRKKLIITLLILLIYRIGCFVPVPGINPTAFGSLATGNDFFRVLSTITGGSLQNGTLFALGILPYINASIILQLLTLVIPPLERWAKEGGEEGRQKMAQLTRISAIVLGIVQGIGIVISWNNSGYIQGLFGMESPVLTMIFVIVIMVAGSNLTMWLGEKITEYGVGNGTSLIIFIGIISGVGTSFINEFQLIGENPEVVWKLILYVVMVLLVFVFIIFVDLAERRITVQYAKQIKGNKMYGGQNAIIPIRVNANGVMPIIFASSFLMFPQMIASFWPESAFYIWWATNLGVGTWGYGLVMAVLILFFAFFYAKIQFDADDISRNIQSRGGFIPGIRPGRPTGDYLNRINNRITLFGALFLAVLSLIPSVVFSQIMEGSALVNAFSATGMLITVSVALEFNKQLEDQLMRKNVKGFLK